MDIALLWQENKVSEREVNRMDNNTVHPLKSRKKILILGSAIVDIIIKIAALPKSGEDIGGMLKETRVGGCAYNVSKILGFLETAHDLFVPVGRGRHADLIRQCLAADGQRILLEDESEDNGCCIAFVEDGGERTFVTIDGLETKWRPGWLRSVGIERYDYIYLSGYGFQECADNGETILQAIEKKKADCRLILDPGPRLIAKRCLDRLLPLRTILELNRNEAERMTGKKNAADAAEALHAVTGEPVIITLGAEGTLYHAAEERGVVPAEKVEAVDTNGAGDSHTAALLAGIASGLSLRESCRLANKIASMVVQNYGCSISSASKSGG